MSVPLTITTECYAEMFMAIYKTNCNIIKNKMW